MHRHVGLVYLFSFISSLYPRDSAFWATFCSSSCDMRHETTFATRADIQSSFHSHPHFLLDLVLSSQVSDVRYVIPPPIFSLVSVSTFDLIGIALEWLSFVYISATLHIACSNLFGSALFLLDFVQCFGPC
jgi:hypothetical protein